MSDRKPPPMVPSAEERYRYDPNGTAYSDGRRDGWNAAQARIAELEAEVARLRGEWVHGALAEWTTRALEAETEVKRLRASQQPPRVSEDDPGPCPLHRRPQSAKGNPMTDTSSLETQASVAEWADDTFGPAASNARIAARANEEMAELLRALTADDNHPKAAEEVADIVIVLYRLARNLGVDLFAEIDRKMAVNRARQWKLDATGHGYHVREKAAAP